MMDLITFTDAGDFKACRAAEEWLAARGFSVGDMERNEPRAIWHGHCYISKWRNLGPHDRQDMHAHMTGDQRNGPVHIRLCPAAPMEAVRAFNRADVKATA